MLIEFEETKQYNNESNANKDAEIESLRIEQYDLENNLRITNDNINKIENSNNESSRKYVEMKEALTTDITSIMKKHSLLKSKQDDNVLE